MPLDNNKIQRLRSDVPALANQIYVNWGGGGPSSKSILREMDKFTKRDLELGSFHPKIRNETTAAQKRTRESCAKLIGVEVSEIALTNNTTVGINIAAAGLAWNAGDEVLVSDLEHPSGYLPWLIWRKRNSIKVKLFKTGKNDQELLRNLEKAITPKTKVVCVSHISWLNGRRFPLGGNRPNLRLRRRALHRRRCPIRRAYTSQSQRHRRRRLHHIRAKVADGSGWYGRRVY